MPICKCGHRQYDHITEEDPHTNVPAGRCWKCKCQKFELK